MGDGPVTASGSLPRRRTHPGSIPVDEQANDPWQDSDREFPIDNILSFWQTCIAS